MTDDEQSSRPRRMVHDAQARCAQAIYQLERARQGLPGAQSVERAKRELHSAVMLYWTQIRRFRDRDDVKKLWEKKALDPEQYPDTSLQDLAHLRLKHQPSEQLVWNDERGCEERRTVSEPFLMPPELALAAHDRLDACAGKLGFDAKTEEQTVYPEPV